MTLKSLTENGWKAASVSRETDDDTTVVIDGLDLVWASYAVGESHGRLVRHRMAYHMTLSAAAARANALARDYGGWPAP